MFSLQGSTGRNLYAGSIRLQKGSEESFDSGRGSQRCGDADFPLEEIRHADGNMSKEEFIRQRDAYRAQEDERMGQIQRLRTEKNQIFLPVKKDTDNLQAMMNTVGEAGDVMHLSQNVVETFIDRIEVFNDERVKIHFTFEDTLKSYETG